MSGDNENFRTKEGGSRQFMNAEFFLAVSIHTPTREMRKRRPKPRNSEKHPPTEVYTRCAQHTCKVNFVRNNMRQVGAWPKRVALRGEGTHDDSRDSGTRCASRACPGAFATWHRQCPRRPCPPPPSPLTSHPPHPHMRIGVGSHTCWLVLSLPGPSAGPGSPRGVLKRRRCGRM